jgi:transposase
MKTQFSIISYFDPYGDMKSKRKILNRKNFESEKSLSEVQKIIEIYNNGKYYNAIEVSTVDNRNKKFQNFDISYYLTSKAHSARYQNIPGF